MRTGNNEKWGTKDTKYFNFVENEFDDIRIGKFATWKKVVRLSIKLEKGLNIFFLFGHDHSNGWDDYLGGSCVCLEKGDTINIAKKGNQFKWETKTLNFTYIHGV